MRRRCRWSRSGAAALFLAGGLALGLAGCAGTGPRGAAEPPLGLSTDYSAVTAPAPLGARDALLRLGDPRSPGGRLRRAHLLLETSRSSDAVRILNGLIFSQPPPRRDVEAVARFLRSRAFAMQGDPVRAGTERDRAAELATEPGLVAALRGEGAVFPGRGPNGPRDAGWDSRPFELTMLGRGAWNADRPTRMKRMGPVRKITVHHSAVLARKSSEKASAAAIAQIQRHHMKTNGWSDVGYHYFVDPDGRVWEGRSTQWQGAHARGAANRGNVGICLLGRFVPGPTGQEPTPVQLAALEALIARLRREYGVGLGGLYTHRELATTQCPGEILQRRVDALRDRLAGRAPARSTARR